MDDNQREELLRSSIAFAKENGITVSPNGWGISWSKTKEQFVVGKNNRCCALGCLILANQGKLDRVMDWKSYLVEMILQVKLMWVQEFQAGFDGYPKFTNSDNGAYELGVLLRGENMPAAQLDLLVCE